MFSTVGTTINATTEKPSQLLFEKLSNQYNDTLKCPCSDLSILYQTFISLQTTFHPICSVNLEPLIDRLFNYTESLSNNYDFRLTGALQFRLLTLLCSSVDEIIKARLIDFNATVFTNTFLLEQSNLENQVQILINQFIQKVTNQFFNSLKMIRIYTFGSQVISGVRSNYKIMPQNMPEDNSLVPIRGVVFWSHSQIYDGPCNCSTSFLCSSSAFIYDNNQTYIVNGFRISCFVLESLLASSLECFYNTSCLNQFLQHIQFNSTFIVQPSNKFNKTDSVEVILNALMVEQWHNSTNYKAYFVACQAKTCFYSFEGHRSLLLVVTTILGLIRGLATVLRFIIPIFVAFARKKRDVQTNLKHSKIRRFRRLVRRQNLAKQIRLINLYKSLDSHTELDIRNEFLSTRIYIIFLIIIFSIVIEFQYFLIHSITVTIQSPSFDTIINRNESSLVCSCSMINIPLKRFLSIEPIFHPICYSDFIDDIWLNTLNTTNNNDARYLELRFRILSLFCQFSRETFQSELLQSGNSYLFSPRLLSKNQFETQINISVEQTVAIARSTFASSLQLMINTSNINKLLSVGDMFQPSGAFLIQSSLIPVEFASVDHPIMPCRLTDQLRNITLNQFYINCDTMQALLDSSFISFYNKSILQSLRYFISNISDRPLNLPIIYPNNATILSILNTLMLDTYSMNLSYKSYFNECHSQTCTYTKKSRESIIDIIAVTIGFVGGLTGILHFSIWYLVRFIRRPKRRNIQNIQKNKIKNLFRFIRNRLRSLNIFRHSGDLKSNEIISTRIFIILFITILVILIFYTSLTWITRTESINKPNYKDFISYDKQYSSTLICSCSNQAIPYKNFLSFSPKFHQICSSVFANREFSDLFKRILLSSYSQQDLGQFGYSIFTAIQTFCDLSNNTVTEQVNTFLATKFVSYQAINEYQFNAEINTIIQAMMQATQRRTIIPIKLIRDTTYSNQIISSLFSNLNMKNFEREYFPTKNPTAGLTNYQYHDCNCLTSPLCITPAIHQRPGRPTFSLDGFFVGCYALESILRSSMNCLYSQKCINDTVINAMNTPVNLVKQYPIALDKNLNSSYNINTTFSQLLDNLMIEKWGQTILHSDYFYSCKPLSCTYSFISRRDFTSIITILFAIIGGLHQLLKLIIPHVVSFIMKKLNKNRIIPTIDR